jgi:hypothetical protein
VLDHLGVEVETTEEVNSAAARLAKLGLSLQTEKDTTCCYARQHKVWVRGPGAEPWEVYTVKEDSVSFGSGGPTDEVAETLADQPSVVAHHQSNPAAGQATVVGRSAGCCR